MPLPRDRMFWSCLALLALLASAPRCPAAPPGCLWLGHRIPTVNAGAVNGYTPTRWRAWAEFQQPCPGEVVAVPKAANPRSAPAHAGAAVPTPAPVQQAASRYAPVRSDYATLPRVP